MFVAILDKKAPEGATLSVIETRTGGAFGKSTKQFKLFSEVVDYADGARIVLNGKEHIPLAPSFSTTAQGGGLTEETKDYIREYAREYIDAQLSQYFKQTEKMGRAKQQENNMKEVGPRDEL